MDETNISNYRRIPYGSFRLISAITVSPITGYSIDVLDKDFVIVTLRNGDNALQNVNFIYTPCWEFITLTIERCGKEYHIEVENLNFGDEPPCGDCIICGENVESRITFNFPGMQNMTVRYWVPGTGWHILAGSPFNDSVEFDAPGATVVSAFRDGLHYSRTITADGEGYIIDAPVIQLYVKGVPIDDNTLGIQGGLLPGTGFGHNWVYNHIPAFITETDFTVFGGDGRTYNVHLSRAGFHPLIRTTSEGYDNGYEYLYVDLSAYFFTIEIPPGFSNVRMLSNNWILNNGSTFWQAGNVIDAIMDSPNNYQYAYVYFTYCCIVNYRLPPFLLDGSNPFDDIECDCCEANPGFPCNLCPDCGECLDCGECPGFRWDIFNNGSGLGASSSRPNADLAARGTIRLWTGFGPVAPGPNSPIPWDIADTIKAVDSNDNCLLEFVSFSEMWDNPGYFNRVDVNKNAPWQRMYLTITVCDETITKVLINSRFFSLHIYNNGPSGTQFPRPNQSLQNAGLIRMWTRLNNAGADVPDSAMTATLSNGECAMEFIRVNRVNGLVRSIDANKHAPWQRIYFSMTVHGQTVNATLVNDLFFSLEIFNNGPGGTQYPNHNASLQEAGLIRMWTQLMGTDADVPYTAMSATLPNGDCAMAFIRVNYVDGGLVRSIDADKHAPWQRIYFSMTVHGQTVNAILVNDLFFSLYIFNNGPDGTPSTPNASLAAAGTIRLWTQLGGVDAPVPYPATITATVRGGGNAMGYITVNRAWDGVWLDNFANFDAAKAPTWEFIDLYITVFGQTIHVVLHNANYVPYTPTPTITVLEQNRPMLAGQNDNVTFTVSSTNIPAGTYEGDINIGRPAGVPRWVTVTIDENGNGSFVASGNSTQPAGIFNVTLVLLDVNGERVYSTPFVFTIVCAECEEYPCDCDELPPTVIVSFDAGYGTGTMDDVHVPVGGNFMLPAHAFTPPTGYEFYGWFVTGYANPHGSLSPGEDIAVSVWPNTTVTVTAIWIPAPFTLTVTYDATMGTATFTPANPITFGSLVALEATPEDGYEFARWTWTPAVGGNPDLSDVTNPNATFNMPARDVTLAAQFRPAQVPPPEVVIVSFDANGGTTGTMTDVNVPVGETFTLPANGFAAPTGYEFYNWFVTGYAYPGGSMEPGDVITVGVWPNTTVTVTAIWVPAEVTEHAVTFLPGGGGGTMSPNPVMVTHGATFALPNNPFTAPTDYEFYGWWISGYADPLGTLEVGYTILVEGPVTVTALWVPISTPPTCDYCDLYPCECELELYIYSYDLLDDGSIELVVNIKGSHHLDGHELRISHVPGGTVSMPAGATQSIPVASTVFRVDVSLMCPDTNVVLQTVIWTR